jgi:hypothetical protein
MVRLRRAPRAAAAAWDRFWFAPRSVAPLVLVRVALGLLTTAWALTLLPDAGAFLGPSGVLPEPPEVGARLGVLQLFTGPVAPFVVVGALVPVGLAITLGWHTRAATIVSFVLLLSIARRDPWILNSGDALLRHATLFLACTPAGAAWSLDARRRDVPLDRFPHAAPWGLRLLQVQLTFVYLFSTLEKLRGEPWLDGTALADAWRIGDLARVGVPMALYDSVVLSAVLTYATLVIELALATLLWNRRARPYVVAAGVALHLGIELTMAVGYFSAVAVSLYLTFVEPATAERWLGTVRRRLARHPDRPPATAGAR